MKSKILSVALSGFFFIGHAMADDFVPKKLSDVIKEYPHTVSVRDYGAFPNDGKDDTLSIRKAISENLKNNGTRIVFEAGKYQIDPKWGFVAEILGADRIMLDGCGAVLISSSRGGIFPITGSKNITIANFNFDTNPLPFAVVKVLSAGQGYFDAEIQNGYEFCRSPVRAINAYDPNTNSLIKGFDLYQLQSNKPAEDLGNGKMRVYANAIPPVGMYVVLRYEVYGEGVVRMGGAENIRLYNLSLYSHAGMGIYAENSKNIQLDNIYVGIPKESARAMSITADATHFNVCRGNLYVMNSSFSRMGDDAMNVHQMYWILAEPPSGKKIKIKFGRKGLFCPHLAPMESETVEFGAQDNWLRPEETRKVISKRIDSNTQTIELELDSPMPVDTAVGTPISIREANVRLFVNNCESYGNRARGFLIQTRNYALIENCLFKDNTMMPILIENDNNYWFEGAGTSNLVIRNCRFINANTWGYSTAAICARSSVSAGTPKIGGVHDNITIENCTFQNCGNNPINLSDTEEIKLVNNKIE